MAKGRKLGSDRRERLLGTCGYGENHTSGGGGDLPDLREEDVWSSAEFPKRDVSGRDRSDEDQPSRFLRRQVGGLSLAFDGAYQTSRPIVLHHQYRNVDCPAPGGGHHLASASAPVNVPLQEAEGFESDGEWLPPHEYVAQEHGKRGAASVFVGVGRTLKGRDMSRVRDAVWSQTGFFG